MHSYIPDENSTGTEDFFALRSGMLQLFFPDTGVQKRRNDGGERSGQNKTEAADNRIEQFGRNVIQIEDLQ
jgi:hypothetical protein